MEHCGTIVLLVENVHFCHRMENVNGELEIIEICLAVYLKPCTYNYSTINKLCVSVWFCRLLNPRAAYSVAVSMKLDRHQCLSFPTVKTHSSSRQGDHTTSTFCDSS